MSTDSRIQTIIADSLAFAVRWYYESLRSSKWLVYEISIGSSMDILHSMLDSVIESPMPCLIEVSRFRPRKYSPSIRMEKSRWSCLSLPGINPRRSTGALNSPAKLIKVLLIIRYIHMTDLVDQMFPPINRKTAPDFTDFNFWRAPAAVFEFPDLSPPSPALSARSDSSSRLPSFPRLNSIASSLSRRSSRSALTGSEITAPPSRTARGTTPSSPLLQATVVEEALGEDDEDDRSESESMPGSLPNGSDFERLRAAALRNGRKDGVTEAEAYKSAVRRAEQHSSEEEEDDSDDDRDDEFGDQLDFSSVPY